MANDIKNSYSQLAQAIQRSQTQDSSLKYVPKKYKEFARGMEKQFAQFMVEQMNKTSGAKEGGTGEQYYKSLLVSERSDMLTKKDGGLGLQKLILNQIYPNHKRNKFVHQQYQAQMEQSKIIRPKFEMQTVPTKEQIKMHNPHKQGVSNE